ncbi:hypothetical protein K501DRAFT_206229, partial [Backusella circina FSU 941]
LRLILYVPEQKLEWYNDFQIHHNVIDALYPVILQHVIYDNNKTTSKQKIETQDTLTLDGFRLNYKFSPLSSKQTLLSCEKDFVFENELDTKPSLKTSYKGLSIYPFQLLVSVDDVGDSNTLESYFKTG